MFVLVSIYLIVPVIKLAYDHKDRRVIYFLVATVFLFSFGTVCLGWVLNAIKLALGYNIVYDGRVSEWHPFDRQAVNPFSGYTWPLVYFIGGAFLISNLKKTITFSTLRLFLVFVGSLFALFCYGMLVSQSLEGKRYDTVWNGYDSIPTLAMTLASVVVLYRVGSRDGKLGSLIAATGANTLGIYFLHIPFMAAIGSSKYISGNIGISIIILLLSTAVALLLKRVPGTAELFRI